MTTLVLETEPVAVHVGFSANQLVIELADGRTVSIPLDWYPRLLNGSKAERCNWRLLGDGYAIEWPDLDEHIGVEGLLAGRKSGEHARSLGLWLTSRVEKKQEKRHR
jgi:Protein of unknown function (DUF2442)